MTEQVLPDRLVKKITDAFSGTGAVYWQPSHNGCSANLRTVTYVYENGKVRSKSLCDLYFDTSLKMIAAIQRQFPEITGFDELLRAGWSAGALEETISTIKEMAEVEQ